MSEAAEVEAGIAQLAAMVESARRLVLEGQLVDLERLEASIGAFCAALQALPDGLSAAARPRMIALVDDLGRLEQAMRDSQAEIRRRLTETSTRRRAVAAYAPSAGDPTKPGTR